MTLSPQIVPSLYGRPAAPPSTNGPFVASMCDRNLHGNDQDALEFPLYGLKRSLQHFHLKLTFRKRREVEFTIHLKHSLQVIYHHLEVFLLCP